jgi:hypothetical protein
MSSILLCIFFLLFLKRKEKKERINALLNRTVEWKGFLFISYDSQTVMN